MSSAPSANENKAERVDKLYTEIEAAAKARDFTRADALRGKLMEVDPTALTQIIGSADLIEKEKAEGLDKMHLTIWDHLYQNLNSEEKNCLFYSMKKMVIPILLSANVRSLRPRLDTLQHLVPHDCCAVCIQESWLDSSVDDAVVQINGFQYG